MEISGVRAQLETVAKACPETVKRSLFLPIEGADANVRGITPDSEYWPQVISAMDDYAEAVCKTQYSDEYLDRFVFQLAHNLSEEQLAQAVKFFSSPAGRRLPHLMEAEAAVISPLRHEGFEIAARI